VTGRPPTFRVHGWIRCADAKVPEYFKRVSERAPSYFVPQDALQPLDTLGTASL
jgi:hypothetical protein